MAVRRYTQEQLLHLRDSPLVEKPDNLPAIEQWLEYVYADKDSREKLRIHHSDPQPPQNASAARRQPQQSKAGGDVSPMGNFSTGLRPGLMTARSSRGNEDVPLGPPRTMFPSSRTKEATGDVDEQDAPRSRFFADKSGRKTMNEKEVRDNKESWTSVRERRALGGDDEYRPEGRYNRRDRDHDGERRNGFGDKHEGRWGGRDDRRQNGDNRHGGGWREREREKKDRDWDRGGQSEKAPEWMDDPTPSNAEDDLRTMGMPRNQEQFQKWKEAMSGKKGQPEEAEVPQAEPALPAKEAAPTKQAAAPLKLEGIVDKPFGGWGESKPSVSTPDGGTVHAKSAQPKAKGSRFASMFKETQPKEETPPVETSGQQGGNGAANGSAEDVAGFNRILQMLGGTGIGQPSPQEGPSSPQPKTAANGTGTVRKSRFTGFFDQAPKSPEMMQSPQGVAPKPNEGDRFQSSRGIPGEEHANVFGGRPPTHQSMRGHTPSNPLSPGPTEGKRDQQSQRMNDIFLEQPPSRGTATPDVNIQNLLASQRAQKAQGQDKNSEFLLNLLQTKGSRPSSQQARPEGNFPIWLDQPPNAPEPHAPKPRAAPPPPGLFEDQLLRNAMPEPPRQEHQQMPGNERRTSQRAPPGFYDEQSMFMQQQQQQQQASQRRNFTEPPPPQQLPGRRMSGHPNIPQMQMPQSQFPGPPPPEFLQSPGAGPQQAPPPGFNPHMPRHPPGFHNVPPPGMFSAQQQQGREPPGFGGGGMPGSAGGMQSPPNAPPGFFGPPPGFMQQGGGMPAGRAAPAMRGGGRGYEGGYDSNNMGGGPRI